MAPFLWNTGSLAPDWWLKVRRNNHLRCKGKKHRSRGRKNDRRGTIRNRRGIELRSPIVDLKKRFGDLEIDTMIGKNKKGALLTINDRAGGYVWIRKLNGKNAEELADATIKALRPLKKNWESSTQ